MNKELNSILIACVVAAAMLSANSSNTIDKGYCGHQNPNIA